MPFDWNQYLILAKSLAEANQDEARLRSAVSRAYYSAFKLALIRAEANGYRDRVDETGSSHKLLWDLYGRNRGSADCCELSLIGPRMKRRRVKADYNSEYARLAEDVRDAISDADKCVELLSRLPAEMPQDIAREYHF
jgi:uncharacterized protein (UPF0332 family)